MAPVKALTNLDELRDELEKKLRQLGRTQGKPKTYSHTIQAVLDLIDGDPNRFDQL